MTKRREGYLWSGQWRALYEVIGRAGLSKSEFEQRVITTTPSWWSGKPRELQAADHQAELRHVRYSDVWFRIHERLPGSPPHEEDGHLGQFAITASPPPRWVPDEGAREVDDFDDLLDFAEDWATVAQQEVDACRIRDQVKASSREQAAADWATVSEGPRAIPQVTGFVDQQLGAIVNEGLRSAGMPEAESRDQVSNLLSEKARADLAQLLLAKSRDEWPRFVASWSAARLADKVAGPVLDRAVSFVFSAVRVFVGLS